MAWKELRSTTMLEDMERPGFFKQYYKTVRQAVPQDLVKQFTALSTDEERVRFCYEKVPEIHDIEIRTFYHGKSERDAIDRKEAGNKAFGRKKNSEALRCYSQAVIKAPVLSEENADSRKMALYPVCLANRSAALYHLNEYYYCVKDIDEALEHHYPKELKYKLYKRKARILVDLKRHLEARDSYRQALKWLDWARMDRDKRMDVQKDIQKWLSIFESGKVVRNAGDFKLQLFPPVPPLAVGSHPVFPSLSKKLEMRYSPTQGRYVVAAEDIKVGDYLCTEKPYAAVLLWEEFGTHCQNCFLVTKAPIPCTNCSGVVFCSSDCRDTAYFHKIECTIQDLMQGSGMSINCFLAFRMLTQTPLSFFVNNKERLSKEEDPESVLHLKPTAPSATDNDPNANTVDDKPNGLTTPITPDGPLSPSLGSNDSNSNGNVIDDSPKKEGDTSQNGDDSDKENKQIKLKDLSEEEKQKLIEEEEKNSQKLEEQRLLAEEQEYQKARKRIEEARRKRLEEQKLKEEMFWRVYNLVRHSENRTVEDFIHRSVMACFMIKALKKTKYFDEFKASGVGNEMKMTDLESLVGGLLLRFLQIIQFNAHEVSEFCLAAPRTLDNSKNTSLGAAIYPTLSYFNHSCHSAQVRSFSGHSVITRAVRPIAKGELVPENYGPCYTAKPRSDRRLKLVDRYWFECQCEACVEDWPTYDNMDNTRLKFKCHKCQAPLLVPVDSPNPLYKCNNCGDQTNILAALKNLQNSEKTFQAAASELRDFNIEKAEGLLQENLEQLSSTLCPPFKDYHVTQEAFMKCTLFHGNRRMKPNMVPDVEEN